MDQKFLKKLEETVMKVMSDYDNVYLNIDNDKLIDYIKDKIEFEIPEYPLLKDREILDLTKEIIGESLEDPKKRRKFQG